MFALLFLIFSTIINTIVLSSTNLNSCSPQKGPAGVYDCVKLDGYQTKQYRNCVSASYIEHKSGGRHTCIDETAKFCWYECMIENYNQENGLVSDDCACSDITMETLNETVRLPPKCYNPSGKDCSLYNQCIDTKHSCSGLKPDNKFDEKVCLLYQDNYHKFSKEGQAWIDAMQFCLQMEIVPLIRPYFNGDCDDIKRRALNTHASCYINPGFGAPSICDLACFDWLKIFWNIKGALLTPDANQVFEGIIEVGSKCLKNGFPCALYGATSVEERMLNSENPQMAALLFVLKNYNPKGRKQTIEKNVSFDRYDFAAIITNLMAEQLSWNHKNLEWFGFTLDENIRFDDNVSMNIWLINKDNTYSMVDHVANEVTKFKDSFSSGKINLNALEQIGIYIKPISLSLCETINCDSFNSTVFAANKIYSGASF